MKVTIKKIAEEAGVSVTTVSNVINHKAHRVSAEKREQINEIITKYNYSPNMNARALVHSSSRLIGLLYFSDKPKLDFSDPFVTEVLEGIERIAKSCGYFTLIHNVTTTKDIEEIQNNWRFDGFIAIGFNQHLFNNVNDSIKSPIVFIDTHLDSKLYKKDKKNKKRFFVNTDDYLSALKATEFLLSKGHKNIAFLSYAFDQNQAGVIQQRFLGYKCALEKAGQSDAHINLYTDDEQEQLLERMHHYDAVLVTADYLAIKFIHFLKQNQRYDQNEIAIIGFDDITYARLYDPPLTTVRLDQISKGELAMKMLVNYVEKREEYPQFTYLEGELIIRETSY